jgi:hypothetical protein
MSFIQKGELKFNEENIKDTFLDTAIYSLIGLILYEEAQDNKKQMTFEFDQKTTASVASTTMSTTADDSTAISYNKRSAVKTDDDDGGW